MIDRISRQDCCGCAACRQVCPRKCITMEEDAEGFLYPVVDKSACVNCGLCEKVCPVFGEIRQHGEVEAYAAYSSRDAIRQSSSSGGLFTPIAEQVIQSGGVVFGAAFDSDFSVHHVKVDTLEGLGQLRGSKYLQSRVENAYIEAKQALETGQTVLFSGTACQIAGLKGYLGKDYDNLLTVDVLCHGVPSPKLWREYLAEQEKAHGAPVRNVAFRSKRTGWKNYCVRMEFQNGAAYQRRFDQDVYMRLFLSNICLRPSCHRCRFKDFPRVSDLTLGDCWGIERTMPEMDDDQGTSVVILNSQKCRQVWQQIAAGCTWKANELNILLPVAADSSKSVLPHPNREKFFTALAQGQDTGKLVKYIDPSLSATLKRKLRSGLRRVKRILSKIKP